LCLHILYAQGMLFPGFPGVATAVGLFALICLIVYLKSKGQPVVFDPGGKHGEFGKRLLPMYLDITKFVWVWRPGRSSCLSAR
jgi:hypothetical protein